MKRLYLVDVSSMYFRAFYAIRPLTNSKGLPTNALYGFLTMTTKLIREEKPDYMVYCFDSKEASFRKEIYSEYKANRSEMPEDLVPQVPYIRKITDVMGIPAIKASGFEADDLIGTLAELGKKNNLEVRIVSGDKDFAQLVGPHVSIYDTMKEVVYDEKGVVEKWGVSPSQFVDYLALVGDDSDNIPGVRGIGPKGAQKLLTDFKDLADIYDRIEEVNNPGLKKKLVDSKEAAFLSLRLSQIKLDVPVDWDIEKCVMRPMDESAVRDLLQELEFKNQEAKIFGVAKGSDSDTAKVSDGLKVAKKEKSTAVSETQVLTETLGPSPTVMQVGLGRLETLAREIQPYEDLWIISDSRGVLISRGQTVWSFLGDKKELGQMLLEKQVKWRGFDLKETWRELKIGLGSSDLLKQNTKDDLLVSSYLVRPQEQGTLLEVASQALKLKLPEFPSQSQMIDICRRLEADLAAKRNERGAEKLYREMELPLISVLYAMEERGICIDSNELGIQGRDLAEDVKRIEKSIFEEVGEEFNLASPRQLGTILFDKLKMPVKRKTKTGYSTDADVLQELAFEFPICRRIIEYRELSKLRSTYVDVLPTLADPRTGRIHTRYNQTLTATGRLSSNSPNLQNIPIRTKRGNLIRRAFVADKGKTLVSADYSQIELRILAHITGDENMCRAFERDLDIHSATASEVFGVSLEAVDADLRRVAKEVNFGIAYGMSAFGLSENLGIPRAEAQDIIGRYFGRFPRIRDYMTETVEEAQKKGFVETIFGRRRYLDELKSSNQMVRKFGERAAINAPVQGSAADIVKIAMLRAESERGKIGDMLLQVHDELILEVDESLVNESLQGLTAVMSEVVKLKVPLKVSAHAGKSWFDAH